MAGKIPFLQSSAVKNTRQILWNLILISAGSAVCAVAVNGILVPRGFVSGGIAGLSLIIHYLLSFLPLGALYLIFNIPLFIMGWKYVGRRFFFYSIVGTLVFSAAMQWISLPINVTDPLLSALLAGIIYGAGSGIILRSAGSSGGMDIVSVMLQTRYSIRLGSTLLAFNIVILTASAVIFSLQIALYTLVYIYVAAHIMDLVVTGFSQRKSVMIVSKSRSEIIVRILKDLNRGVTIIKGQGGYSEEPADIIYTVIAFRELAGMKRLINQIDPDAFVVISDTAEVMGYRIGNQPHW